MRFLFSLLFFGLLTAHASPTREKYNKQSAQCTHQSKSSAKSHTSDNTKSQNATTGSIDSSLVPEFGVKRGIIAGSSQPGSCVGSNSQNTVLIPCFCPPNREAFIIKLSQAVAAGSIQGTSVTFNNNAQDKSVQANKDRATAMLKVLQNFNDTTPGIGCTAASAPNFLTQQKTGVVVN